MRSIKLFFSYSRMLIKSNFQYKANALFLSFGVFIRESVSVVIMYLLLKRFGSINGWNLKEMLFLYSLIFISYSLLVLFFTGIRDFSYLIQKGDFDRYLVRPINSLFQVIISKADYFAAIGHGLVGISLFIFTSSAVGIKWDLYTILYYLFAITGGVLIQLSIWLIGATFSFFTVKSNGIINFFYWNTRKFAGYPVSIFPAFIKAILIYIVPFAFVNYFPAQYFLRKNDMHMFWEGSVYLTPFVGLIMVIMATSFWKIGLKRYSSTGN